MLGKKEREKFRTFKRIEFKYARIFFFLYNSSFNPRPHYLSVYMNMYLSVFFASL